jgi:hypothetical protein
MACRAASGIQPGDEVRAIRRGQLTREEGEVPSKVKPVGTHRGGGASTARRGHLRTAAPVAASGGRGGGPATRGSGEGGCWWRVGAEKARGRRDGKSGCGTLLKGAAGRQQRGGGVGGSWLIRGGLEEEGPGSHRRGHPGRHDMVDSGPAVARAGGVHVRTATTGVGSVTGGTQMAAGGRGARVACRESLTVGPGNRGAQWPVTGCRVSATRHGADMQARQHSAARFGFKPI